MKKVLNSLLLACATLAAAGCYTNPVTGRKSLVLISPGEEVQLGAQSFQAIRAKERVSADPAANARVQRIGRRIAEAVGNELPGAKWEFVVFDSKELNAFALPGGKVGVYTGLMQLAPPTAAWSYNNAGFSLAGRLIEVVAAPEPLAEIRVAEPRELARLAYHLGNRHLPVQILANRIRIRGDEVIENMARGLGAKIAHIEAAFDPEGGAYAGPEIEEGHVHGPGCGHDHHDHDHHGHDHHGHDHHGHDHHGHDHHGHDHHGHDHHAHDDHGRGHGHEHKHDHGHHDHEHEHDHAQHGHEHGHGHKH